VRRLPRRSLAQRSKRQARARAAFRLHARECHDALLWLGLCAERALRAGELATSGMAFWSLLASVLALAIAAQYALIVAGGARGAAHYAHDKWLATRSYAQHAGHSASQVMHGAPHWAWASADIGHPAEALMKRARGGVLRWRAWPWNWLRSSSWSYGDTPYYDAPHGAGDTLWTRLFWKRRPACDPPIKCAFLFLCLCIAAHVVADAMWCAQTATGRAWLRRTRATAPARPRSGARRTCGRSDARSSATEHTNIAAGGAARRGRRAQRTRDAAPFSGGGMMTACRGDIGPNAPCLQRSTLSTACRQRSG
jgi:hypothetical protein